MPDVKRGAVGVRARAVLVDPASLAVVWMNEAAAEAVTSGGAPEALALAEAVPVADGTDVGAVVADVAATGRARHLRTDLVSTGRGAMALVTSVYRLPSGGVLVITEHSWKNGRREKAVR